MEDIKLGKLIKFLSVNLEKEAQKELKELDISLTQGILLLWLCDNEQNRMSIKSIEKRYGTAQSTVF